MPFEILLKKPVGREKEDNRIWTDFLVQTFPGFRPEEIDAAAARELAESGAAVIGLTADDYVARGIGACVQYERDDFFIDARFYDEMMSLDLPNFPQMGALAALREVRPIIDALVSVGFELLDPQTGQALTRPREEALIAAYEDRQETVEHVQRLVDRER